MTSGKSVTRSPPSSVQATTIASSLLTVQTPGRRVTYAGEARIDGVPGTAAPIPLEFRDTAGSSCGALLPTGDAVNMIEGVACDRCGRRWTRITVTTGSVEL